MTRTFKQLVLLLTLLIAIGTGCRKQGEDRITPADMAVSSDDNAKNGANRFDSYVVQSWYNLIFKLTVETPGHTPPIVARTFAYTGVTLYESLMGEMVNRHSLVGQLKGLNWVPPRLKGNSYYAPETANAALAGIINDLFANASVDNIARIDSLEMANEKMYSVKISREIIKRSHDYGRSVADAIFNWSKTDGGDQAYLRNYPTDYIPPVGFDKWVPTPPLFQPAMLPYWGTNRPMLAVDEAGAIDPPAPPAFSTTPGSHFYNAAYELYYRGLHLSAEDSTIALYWADGAGTFSPPGHNIAITLQMIRNHNLNLYDAATLLAKVGLALGDAGLVCWRAKYVWNLLRPVTFIRTYIDTAWMPLIVTPPFPSYSSGHSTFSAATAEILTEGLGHNVSFMDSSKIPYGFIPRSFQNFKSYAGEAAKSRFLGGIHYTFDNQTGLACGHDIAVNVEHLNW